jgi:hypothetical protein
MKRLLIWMVALFATALVATSASAKSFVDATLGDVKAEERVDVTNPKPVQLLFQFKTAGKLNPRATKFLKEVVTKQISESKAFSEVSEQPVTGGAILQITIDNLAAPEAAGQGMRAGLTFGLAGELVADNYEAKLEYVGGPSATTITTTARHRLYTTIGLHKGPENAIPVRTIDDGIKMVVRQMLDRVVTDLTRDVGFGAIAAPTTPDKVDPIAPPVPVEQPVTAPSTPPALG